MNIESAFILGAGLGTRLRPLTDKCPKPLLELGGRPIITRAMDHLLSIDVKRFIVNTHHCAEVYDRYFPDGTWRGIPIVFRHEPVLLDTAGGLKNIEDLVTGEEGIIVYNGDIVTDLSLKKLITVHREKGTEVTIALRSQGTPRNVDVDSDGMVCDLRHILGRKGEKTCLFAGIYVVERTFLDRLERDRAESVVMPWVRMLEDGSGRIAAALLDEGHWYDIGTPAAYEELRVRHGR